MSKLPSRARSAKRHVVGKVGRKKPLTKTYNLGKAFYKAANKRKGKT